MFDPITGFLFVRLGGMVRFIYGTFIRKIGLSKSRYYSLKEYIHGSEDPEDDHWNGGASHEFVNRIVGVVSIVIILFLAIRFL